MFRPIQLKQMPFLAFPDIWIHPLDADGVATFLALVRGILAATKSKHKERAGLPLWTL